MIAEFQHPVLSTIHPWLLALAIVAFGATSALLIWSYFADEHDCRGASLGLFLWGLLLLAVTHICNPLLDSTERSLDIAAIATFVFWILGYLEVRLWPWRIKPFMY
jgi:hypothetical protein